MCASGIALVVSAPLNRAEPSRTRYRLWVALLGAAALSGLAAPAAAEEGAAPGAGTPTLVPRGGHLDVSRSYGTTRGSSSPSLPRPLAHEGWRFSSQIAPIFPTSDLGDSRDLLAASTGFSPRINLGYEHMFGNLGVTPGFAFQLARFGMQYQDGSVLYFGAQPNVQAALHLGRFAPYASLGLGLDNFRLAGQIADLVAALGGNTSAIGLGLDLQFGANVLLTPSVSAGIALQIHPGFTQFKLADDATTSGGMAFMSVLFGVSYLM